jgi:hypothetical protein
VTVELIPFRSIGPLSFGDGRQVSREKIGSTFSTFQKVNGAHETDSFDDLGLHLYYDTEDRLEFVEAFGPADVTFRGIAFLGRPLEDVAEDMKSMGFDATESDIGLKFEEAGIALTAPSGIVEGIAAHRLRYYD